MAKKITALAVGNKVKFGKYYGKDIVWVIGDKNHTGYPTGAITLVAQKAIKFAAFDAAESGGDTYRVSYGNNRWIYSNIRTWLNSNAANGKWYKSRHSYDRAPSNDYVSGSNAYDTDAGFLNAFASSEQNAILSTSLKVGRSSTDGGGTENDTCKVFLLSCTEAGIDADVVAGKKLAYFTSNAVRQLHPTAEACSHDSNGHAASSTIWWWTRDAYASYSCDVRSVSTDGTWNYNSAYSGNGAVVPALNLGSDLSVSDSPDADGCYTLQWNTAPSAPVLHVADHLDEKTDATVTWDASVDADGNLAGYKLERKLGSGNWVELLNSPTLSYTESVLQDWTTVAYRVKAYDTMGAESAYSTSATLPVHHAPTISGADRNLGTFTMNSPSAAYSITDTDGNTITVKEYFDGALVKTHAPTMGTSYTVTYAYNEWIEIKNGDHNWTIVADGGNGLPATRVIGFTKDVKQVILRIKPIESLDYPILASPTVNAHIADGATIKVETCNNAYDANPTWEDCTNDTLAGNKYFFINVKKVAAGWGVGMQVTIDRGTATKKSTISQIGVVFGRDIQTDPINPYNKDVSDTRFANAVLLKKSGASVSFVPADGSVPDITLKGKTITAGGTHGVGEYDKELILDENSTVGNIVAHTNTVSFTYALPFTVSAGAHILTAYIPYEDSTADKMHCFASGTTLTVYVDKDRLGSYNAQGIAELFTVWPLECWLKSSVYASATEFYTGFSITGPDGDYRGYGVALVDGQLFGQDGVYDTYEPRVEVGNVIHSRITRNFKKTVSGSTVTITKLSAPEVSLGTPEDIYVMNQVDRYDPQAATGAALDGILDVGYNQDSSYTYNQIMSAVSAMNISV